MGWMEKQRRSRASRFTQRKDIRGKIFKRDDYKCLRCGATKDLTLDHIVSVYKEGENSIDNLQTLCRSCNAGKKPEKSIDYRGNRSVKYGR